MPFIKVAMINSLPATILFSNLNIGDVKFYELLDICSNPGHRHFQQGWYDFERRYRNVILGRIRMHLRRWNEANNTYTVEEIASRVVHRLLANNYRALKSFRGRDHEGKFISFLNVICRNTAHAFMLEKITRNEVDLTETTPELKSYLANHSEVAEELHDYLVGKFRQSLAATQKSDYHIERDILIYLLRVIGGFKAKEVEQIPLLNVTQSNVDNVMNRLSSYLR
jgi:hypothetical protein